MKKKLLNRIIPIFLAIILLSLSMIVFAGAEEVVADSGAPASAVWQITHKDGTVEYADTFKGGFSRISDGDIFKLLPKTYNVYLADYATVRMTSAINITIDLRGTTIIAPEKGDVNGQIFNISDSNKGATVNVLMENATIYAAPGGRCAFAASGYTVINIDGGKDGGKIYAGGALNLTSNYSDESTYSTIKNMYCYKSTPNMAGMICARNTSKLKLVDTYAVGGGISGATLPLYVRNSGCMILENSHGISLSGGNVLEFVEVTEETSFTLGCGSTLYGVAKGLANPSLMKIASGTHIERTYPATLIGDSYISDSAQQIKHNVYTSDEVGTEKSEEITLAYPYYVRDNAVLEDVQTAESVWRIEGAENVKYATSLTAIKDFAGTCSKATLLVDIEISEASVVDVKRDFELDFAGKSVKLASGADVGFAFIINGAGNVTVTLSSSKVNLIGTGFLRANNTGSVRLTSSGMVAADVLVSKTKADSSIVVDGGTYLTRFGDSISAESAVELKNISLTAESTGTLVRAAQNIKMKKCVLVAKDGAMAIHTDKNLILIAENCVAGRITAADISAGDYSYFTDKPVYVSISTPLIAEMVSKKVTLLLNNNGTLSVSKVECAFSYYTREYNLSDTQKSDSVWKLEDENGTVKYTDHVYTPFINLSDYVNFTLLCDLNLTKNFALSLLGDIKIDLGSSTITLASGYNKGDPVFDASGDGVITLTADGATVDVSGATFVRVEKLNGITLTLQNSFISADKAVLAQKTPITASGGYYSVKNSVFTSTDAEIALTSLSAYSSAGATLLESDSDISVNSGVELVVQNGGKAIYTTEKLMVADGVYIVGNTAAAEFYSAGCVNFTLKPTFEKSNMLVVQSRENKEITIKSLTDGKITETKTKFILSYTTVNITDGLKVSMYLASDAALNVYVPTAIVNHDPTFTLRIVLDGLLYEAKAGDGTAKTVDGKSYVRFSYPYVYPDSYEQEAKITLISAGFTGVKNIAVVDYLNRALEATASDEMRAVIASYAAYSAECSGVKLAADSPISQYANRLTVYREEDAESLFDYFRAVRYEPTANELRFTPWTSCDYTVGITYKFGETDMAYTFNSKDGAFALPIYRFVMSSDFVMTFTDSETTKTLNVNLYDLAYFAEKGSDTRLLLTLYLAYASALGKCVGE